MSLLQTLGPLIVGEIVTVTFDFGAAMPAHDTISAAVVTPKLVAGTDPDLAQTVTGAPVISGRVVTQLISAGVAGVVYRYLCAATLSDSQKIILPIQLKTVDY